MLWLSLLLLCPLPLAVAAVHEELVNLAAAGRGVIKLDPTSYELLISGNRNWSASIEFTALDPRHACGPCNEFHATWTAVAKAWAKAPSVHRDAHFFATLDFDAAPAVFRKLGLVSAPAAYMYPPTEGPRAAINNARFYTYDFSYGFSAERLAQQVSDLTPIPVPYSPPVDWVRWAAISGGVLVLGVALYFITTVWIWAVGAIGTSLVMTSGFMFTRIRESPWVGHDGGWIARGWQDQFGTEVLMVVAIYAILGFSFTMLIMVVPNQSSPRKQRVHVYVWSTAILFVYSFLIVFYKAKRPGYPFKLVL